MGVQEDGEATDEEEQDSQDSESWMTMDQGKLQGARDKNFSEESQGEPEQTELSQVVFPDLDMRGWTNLMLPCNRNWDIGTGSCGHTSSDFF